MKRSHPLVTALSVLLMGALAFSALGQDEYFSCDQLKEKRAASATAAGCGIALAGAGGVVTIIGAVKANDANQKYYEKNLSTGQESGDKGFGTGATMMLVGIPICITGAVLSMVGFSKFSNWKQQSRLQQCRLHLEPGVNSVQLVWTF